MKQINQLSLSEINYVILDIKRRQWYCIDMSYNEIMLCNCMLSTYINALARNGFVIELLVEETYRDSAIESESDFGRKALILPTAFVIKARKYLPSSELFLA